MMSAWKALTAVCVLALSGCYLGNKYNYDDSKARLGYSGQRRVAVAAWDQREYVLSGNKNPDFVGLQRSGLAVPFNVHTASRQPLAAEMTDSLVQSLAGAGFGASPVRLTPQDTEASARTALLRERPARALLLRVDNWESDTYKNPTVYYDLTLSVYDGSGRRLASSKLQGKDDLKGSVFNPMGTAKKIVPETFRRKIEILLNAPEVAAALK